QVYLNAVQLLTGNGGWPLNCIALPDGRPIYGGTYFPKEQWLSLLKQVTDFVAQNPEKAEEQAQLLTEGVQADVVDFSNTTVEAVHKLSDLDTVFANWKSTIDYSRGGYEGTQKFPLPVGYQFLLNYHYLSGDKAALEAVTLTLDKMASGGIYDQIGGGFARYSTDPDWKVPHFEKMLYDNAQLVGVYARAYQQTKNPRYKAIAVETLDFVARELTDESGGFYASLDADSEGEEGKFYIWTKKELQDVLGKKADLILEYYNITEEGNWEDGKNILYKTATDSEIAEHYGISEDELIKRISAAKEKLLKARNKRVRPALDTKILTSWNALMLKAYVTAYLAFDDKKYLNAALKNAEFIRTKVTSEAYKLYRNYTDGKATVNAFLDDYAFTISAFMALYQATFDEKWLTEAQQLSRYTLAHFYDEEKGMFYYTSDDDPALIARKIEVADNVIPSANAEMAKNLFALGLYFSNDDYIRKSERMLNAVKQSALEGGVYYANWDVLMAWFAKVPYEVAIVGDDFEAKRKAFANRYMPDVFLSGGATTGTLPLLENKLVPGQTTIYVCRNKTCKYPVTEVAEALKQLE
ncbi:MAG: thioredoxin domain-containing protein, partial [Bacteroidota bacterium]